MNLMEKNLMRLVSLALTCLLACSMVPTRAYAVSGNVDSAVTEERQIVREDDAPQNPPVLSTEQSDANGSRRQEAAQSVQEASEQAVSPLVADPRAHVVTIEGPDEVSSPDSMTQKVMIDGVLADESIYKLEWFERFINTTGLEWLGLINSRGAQVTGNTFIVAATSVQELGEKGEYYCQVARKDTGEVLNPIDAKGADVSDPMKSVRYLEDKTCAIIATKDATIAVRSGESQKGLSISADGKTITMKNMNIDGSENTEGWASDAVHIIASSVSDITIDVQGTNTLSCKFDSNGANWGYGLFVDLVGNHNVTLTTSTGDGTLVSSGGAMGCHLGGGNGEGAVNYHVGEGLKLVCTSNQSTEMKTAVGALVLSRAGLTVEDATLDLKSNGGAGLTGFYALDDPYDIVLGQGAKVSVDMQQQPYGPNEAAVAKGIDVSGEKAGGLTLNGAEVSVNLKGLKYPMVQGVAAAGGLEVKGSSSLSVLIDTSNGAETQSYFGVQASTVKIDEQSNVGVKSVGSNGVIKNSMVGLLSFGRSENVDREPVVTIAPKVEILGGSTVDVDLNAGGEASGIYAYTQDRSSGSNTPFGTLTAQDSHVSIALEAGTEAIGIETHKFNVAEEDGYTLSASAKGEKLSCAIMAIKGASIPEEHYTPGYKSMLWNLGDRTAVLTPAKSEINVLSVEYPTMVDFQVGEVVFDPADTAKPAPSVVIGKRGPIIVDPKDNHIDGIAAGSRIVKGTAVGFTAVGAGMDTSAPIAGDTRYIPVSWKVNPQGSWTAAPYSARFETKDMAVGSHTLNIVFDKEAFDGTAWVKVGSTDAKSVTFELFEQRIPATGDSVTGMLIALVALGAAGALALVWVRKKGKICK